jgi:digeranylgeranylglycerophospholipid reductase
LLQVAIVGGGPIGSRVAFKLAEYGYKTAVFEKRNNIGQKPCCTGIISQECVEKFSIPKSVILKTFNSASIFSPSGEYLRVFKTNPQAHILNRSAFDCELASQAQKKGVEYYLNSKIENLEILKDKVVLSAVINSENCKIETQYAVIAAGFCSPLVKQIGLGGINYVVAGAQVEVEIKDKLPEVEVYFDQSVAPGFFSWLVPISDNRCLAGLMTRQSPGKHLRNWLSVLESKNRIKKGNIRIRYGGIPLKTLSKTYSDRLLVVGDAAGQVKPTTGGGIYFGLLCADIAVDTLHKCIVNNASSARDLSIYEKLWSNKLSHELKVEYLTRRFYEKISNKQIEGIFRQVKKSGLVESMMEDGNLSFDWHGDLLLTGLRSSVTSGITKLLKSPFNKP